MAPVQLACHYLGLDPKALAQALCFRHMETRDESYDVPQNVLQVKECMACSRGGLTTPG